MLVLEPKAVGQCFSKWFFFAAFSDSPAGILSLKFRFGTPCKPSESNYLEISLFVEMSLSVLPFRQASQGIWMDTKVWV